MATADIFQQIWIADQAFAGVKPVLAGIPITRNCGPPATSSLTRPPLDQEAGERLWLDRHVHDH